MENQLLIVSPRNTDEPLDEKQVMIDDGHRRFAKRIYMGIDVGGTKIQATLVAECGTVLDRLRISTPRNTKTKVVLDAINKAIEQLLQRYDLLPGDLSAIGIAIPGVVDPDAGIIVVTPNMGLCDVPLVEQLQQRFNIPVAMGNDCNLGVLAECWCGAAAKASSAAGILLGTGIGGGFVLNNTMWTGARETAMEIGHMTMQIDGPKCGCGGNGCFEALASRTAIERDIRAAVADGKSTTLNDLLKDKTALIRSGALQQALKDGDKVVTKIMRRAAQTLGHACNNVRHTLDPEVIVLGGGVIEACGGFMLPIVNDIVEADPLAAARDGGHVCMAALGDDSVALGTVAMARKKINRDPFDPSFFIEPQYAAIEQHDPKQINVGRKVYDQSLSVCVNGQVRTRKASPNKIKLREVMRVCKGGPRTLFIGAGTKDQPAEPTADAKQFLQWHNIDPQVMSTPQAIDAYNRCTHRRAALLRI